MLPRITRIFVGFLLVAAAAAAVGALFVPVENFRPAPVWIALVALTGLAVLFAALIASMRRVQTLDQSSSELALVKLELETTVRALQQRHRELQASEMRYRGLVEQQGDVIMRRMPDGRLTFVNDAFCTLSPSRASARSAGNSRPNCTPAKSFDPRTMPTRNCRPVPATTGD